MDKYIMLDKAVGETPLSCVEKYRALHPELKDIPLAYAGRLDPMASGKLLVLLGEECKNQTAYHGLDKEYKFSVLFGIGSDSHDVLGRLKTDTQQSDVTDLQKQLERICQDLTGEIKLPYPHFSAKTVQGKPLHMWTLENRLHEITIPDKTSTIYSLMLNEVETKIRAEVCAEARAKIDSIPEVTEKRKALGNDFRRADVRRDWENILKNMNLPEAYQIAHFTCLASSGTYMRTLAYIIGQRLNPTMSSLAWSIHRSKIGIFDYDTLSWTKEF